MQIGIEIAKAEDRDGFVVDDDGIIRGGTRARAADRCGLKTASARQHAKRFLHQLAPRSILLFSRVNRGRTGVFADVRTRLPPEVSGPLVIDMPENNGVLSGWTTENQENRAGHGSPHRAGRD